MVKCAVRVTLGGHGFDVGQPRVGVLRVVDRVGAALLQSQLQVELDHRVLRAKQIEEAHGVGPRAWTALAASFSPNAYVVDIEPETESVLLHDLVPRRSSESPA